MSKIDVVRNSTWLRKGW